MHDDENHTHKTNLSLLFLEELLYISIQSWLDTKSMIYALFENNSTVQISHMSDVE